MLGSPGRVGEVGRTRRGGAGGAVGKTYADWLAHLANRTTRSVVGYDGPHLYGAGLTKVLLSDTTGVDFYGTSWGGLSGAGFIGEFRGGIAHGMASSAAYQAQGGLTVLVNVFKASVVGSLASFTRNGRSSKAITQAGIEPYGLSELSYWDAALGLPKTMNPQAGTGPVDYAAPGW